MTRCNKMELKMSFKGEWFRKDSFLLLEYKDFWQKCIKSMFAQGFRVLTLIKVLCVQCKQIFAVLVPKL